MLFLRAEISFDPFRSKERVWLLAAISCLLRGDHLASVDITTKIVHARAIFLNLLAYSTALSLAPCLTSPRG